jgi:hypothetical protein
MRRISVGALSGVMATVAITILTASNACSGGGSKPLTLAEYFAQLDNAWTTHGDTFETAQQPASAFDSEAEEVAALSQAFKADSEAIANLSKALGAITPPPEAQDAHERFVASSGELAEGIFSDSQRLADAKSKDDVRRLYDPLALEQATLAFYEACEDLQVLGENHRIELSMDCNLGPG